MDSRVPVTVRPLTHSSHAVLTLRPMSTTTARTTFAVLAVAGLVATGAGAMSVDKSTTRDVPILGLAASGTFVAVALDEG